MWEQACVKMQWQYVLISRWREHQIHEGCIFVFHFSKAAYPLSLLSRAIVSFYSFKFLSQEDSFSFLLTVSEYTYDFVNFLLFCFSGYLVLVMVPLYFSSGYPRFFLPWFSLQRLQIIKKQKSKSLNMHFVVLLCVHILRSLASKVQHWQMAGNIPKLSCSFFLFSLHLWFVNYHILIKHFRITDKHKCKSQMLFPIEISASVRLLNETQAAKTHVD